MFEYLEGEVALRTPARLVLDVHGVGYALAIPIGSGFPERGRTRAWTHLVVRDDAHWLAGFPERETRELFRLLLGVTGVGPVMGLSILSGLEHEPLLTAIAEGDVATLTRIRGVGKKTADQIVLDLREKATRLRAGPAAGTAGAQTPSARGEQVLEDAVAALISIGYGEKEARKNVAKAAEKTPARELETLVRSALAL